jgi:hypothetical protein
MATNQDSNRRSLHSIIKNEFISVKTNKTLTYDEWFNLFFKNANTLTDEGSTSDENGTKYNNLFTTINFKKIKSGGDLTVINYYFKTTAKNSADWRKKLTSKEEFYKAFACDLSWAQTLNFCKGNITPTPTINLDDYTGNFQDTKSNYVFSITKKNENGVESLNLNIYGLPSGYDNLLLKPTTTKGTFEVPLPVSIPIIGTPTIKYDTDLSGFTYDLIIYKGTAKKVVSKTDKDSTDTKKSDDNTNDTSTSDVNKEKQQKLYQNILQYGPSSPIEPNIKNPIPCNDFPFKIGCQNKLIGDINEVLFNNRLDNTYDKSHTYKYLDNNDFFGAPGEKDGEISRNMYDKIMSLKENLLRKKVIKETVKKVLKERILKK